MDSSADHRRPHRTSSINSSSTNTAATATSELFICFTSRLSSSSSMKLSSSSKSILSPARARDAPPTPQISLSSSLSRRLRSSGGLKGGQASPMFPSSGKKRGAAGFENPEPSSPKVTCIGQVRVKTKKQGKKLRTKSRRKGEVSFRKLELSRSGHHSFPPQQPLNGNPECLPHWNQRWVHFPVNICEALRTFGADWSCFLPCRSSCMSSKEENAVAVASRSDGCGGNGGSSCGAVVARWLVAVQEGEGRGRKEIELVVGGEEIPAETKESSRSQRRHVFEGIEFNEEEICRKRKDAEVEEEKGRVSICIPPKNALLLMRYKSDPVKMSALANQFCRSPVQRDEEDEDRDYEECQGDGNGDEKVVDDVEIEQVINDSKEEVSKDCRVAAEAIEEQRTVEQNSSSVDGEEEKEEEEQEKDQEITAVPLEESVQRIEENEEEEREEILSDSGAESPLAHRNDDNSGEEEEEAGAAKTELLAKNDNDSIEYVEKLASTPTKLLMGMEEAQQRDAEPESNVTEEAMPELEGTMQDMAADSHSEQKNPNPDAEPESIVTENVAPEPEGTMPAMAVESGSQWKNPKPGNFDLVMESKGRDSVDREPVQLPDCLLLMMREPKLSMEVSKETWVCSADIIRWLPQRHVHKATAGGDDPKKRAAEVAPNTKRSCSALTSQQARILQQPPRSSCSFPSQAAAIAVRRGGESMAAMIEQKLMNAKPGEPLVLTRCKSEPMRTAIKLAPDACFWKNRKLEPHQPSTNLRVN